MTKRAQNAKKRKAVTSRSRNKFVSSRREEGGELKVADEFTSFGEFPGGIPGDIDGEFWQSNFRRGQPERFPAYVAGEIWRRAEMGLGRETGAGLTIL